MGVKKLVAVLLFVLLGWLAIMLNFMPFPGTPSRPAYAPATLPPFSAPAAGGLSFAVIGDFGNDSADEARVAALVAGWEPDFVLTTGDNNYPDGEASTIDENIGQYYGSFIGNYQGSYGEGSPSNRFWPSLGNHDWHTIDCNTGGCAGAYFDYFTLPGNERYYEADYGLVRLFALDSDPDEPDGVQSNSIQAEWLQGALAASDACFDVVFFHHPPYSSGKHGSTEHMRWPFAAWGADVVMSGHEHSYERVDVGGVPYFVNGSGGKSLYEFTHIGTLPVGATSVARYNADYGAMRVTVTETGLTSQFFNAEGVLIDTYTLSKSCPTAATATATATSAHTHTPTPTIVPSATPSITPTWPAPQYLPSIWAMITPTPPPYPTPRSPRSAART